MLALSNVSIVYNVYDNLDKGARNSYTYHDDHGA